MVVSSSGHHAILDITLTKVAYHGHMSVAHCSQQDRAPLPANTSKKGAPCFSANRFDASQATEAKLEVNPAAVANSGASRPGIGAIAAAAVDAGTMLLAGIAPAMQVRDDLTDSWPTPLSGAQQGHKRCKT